MSQKSSKNYHCKKCDYITSNKYDYKKHLSTAKHKKDNKRITNDNNNSIIFSCANCGKKYKFRSGLSRHKKKCLVYFEQSVQKFKLKKSQKNATTLYGTNLKSFAELTKALTMQGELIEKLVNTQKDMIPKLGNNNNNKIAINVFLNKHCKRAMNIGDFIDNIKISLEDLEYTNEHGYVKGISNIFTKNLTDLKATERPIHCSDSKRLHFYVKDENKWIRDNENKKINNTIQEITRKQIIKLKQWEDAHPNYLNNNSLYIEWQTMVQKLMGGDTIQTQAKNTDNIKKTISQKVNIKEANRYVNATPNLG